MATFSNIFKAGSSRGENVQSLVEEIDAVISAADANNKIMILHSPKNFGGTRLRPDDTVVCMQGLGTYTMYVHINLRTALVDCQIVVPVVTDLFDWETANDVANIPAPKEDGLIGFESSAVFMPAPVLWNAILTSGTNKPFELIPIITDAARNFYSEHEEDATMTSLGLNHVDNLNTRLYSVKMGLINKTRYQINPNNMEATNFCKERLGQCIKGVLGTSVSFDSSSVISHFANAISAQNKEAMKSNRLCWQEIKDQTDN